ncbi:MAG: MarR family transcriptional regulator [Alphaproteobacteria bacterium]|nr:MarR family transcriptional regulator [Alphaproteobacteria bacterium]MBV9371612.1 MarR family transcriptional regulator [Alphaproteobacteria bacterium]MBV9901045.1 MarR family transcriptional regulator [Alphaproteobacteria bacterium]
MDTNFAFDVNETARALRRAFEHRAADHGVTRAQWRVLSHLKRQDGLRQVELADRLDVEPITLCRMIDRLEEAGLVERRPDEADRRAWRIRLTPKSGPIIEDLRQIAEEFLEDALAGVTEVEQAAVRDVLARVRANVAPGAAIARRAS